MYGVLLWNKDITNPLPISIPIVYSHFSIAILVPRDHFAAVFQDASLTYLGKATFASLALSPSRTRKA